MEQCKICGVVFQTPRGLALHSSKAHEISPYDYHLMFIDANSNICNCGKLKKFRGITVGFKKYCSRTCSNKSRKGKPTGRAGSFPPQKEKICEKCKNIYKPISGMQRWCTPCAPDKESRALICRYGISKYEFDEMVKNQNGNCALCDRKFKFVDHCHKTGRVRGLLCNACNSALGRVEIPGWVDRAKVYLS